MALAAPSSSSRSPSLDDLPKLIKCLAIDNKDNLLEYTTDGKTTILVKNIGSRDGSSVALVGNRIYVVGGQVNYCPTSRVDFYDMTTQPLVKTQAPSLISPKCNPVLLVMGSNLFAFSCRFGHETPSPLCDPSPLWYPECFPIGVYLDTSSPCNTWCPLKTFPRLPCPTTNGFSSYSISSSAVQLNNHSLFLSFGCGFDTLGVSSICYNHSKDLWTNVQPYGLPFLGDGKFVDDMCFGFPFGMDRDYVTAYKFAVDWKEKNFTCFPLATYDLLSNSTLTNYPDFFSFELVSPLVLTTIRTKLQDNPSPCEIYLLELEVVDLLTPPKLEGFRKSAMGELHETHVRSITTYTMYNRLQAIIGVLIDESASLS